MPHQTMCIDNNFEELADGSKVQVLLLWQDFNYLAERGAQQDTNCKRAFGIHYWQLFLIQEMKK